MGINIRTNVESLKAQRALNSTTESLRTSYARLSSGLRITQASDDAAGLSIAEKLRADARVATVAMRNANDGISIIAISDGAMDQLTTSLMRMGELAEQSANGVYSNEQRSALQLEFTTLGSEIERVAATTKFNGLNLLSGGQIITLQVGFDGLSNSQISYSGVAANLAALGLSSPDSSALTYSISDNNEQASQVAARSALDAIGLAINSLTRSRGTLGAAESRLNSAIQNLQVARENFQAGFNCDIGPGQPAAKFGTELVERIRKRIAFEVLKKMPGLCRASFFIFALAV